MKVTVKNYRGCAEAEFDLAPLALVAGTNHAGKSSIAQAMAAALTRNAAPIDGVTKGGAGVLLRDGEKRGRCTVGDESGSVSANWPGASVSEDGTPPVSSAIACGLASIVDMKPKEAAAALIHVMGALPAMADLQAACPGVRADLLRSVWGRVEADGWDAAHRRATERSAQLKGAWEQITGEKWGSQKAEGWRSRGLPDDAGLDVDAEVTTCQQALERAIANQATDAAEVERLRTLAAKADSARATITNLEAEAAEIAEAIELMRGDLQRMPQPETAETMVECPHCKGHLVVVSRTEVRAPSATVSAAENEERAEALARKRKELADEQAAAQQVATELAQWRAALSDAERAQEQLDGMKSGTGSAADVQAARDALAQAQAWRVAVQATAQAQAKHAEIVENNALVAALAPDGVRRTVLATKLAALNQRLADLCQTAGWAPVVVADDLSVSFAGRPFVLLSASEQYRARVTLQVALADLDGSDVVIVDAADILDRGGRNGLFAMLRGTGMRSLVCMTMNRVEDVPDLGAAGIGRSYWIGGSVLAPVGT